jgi:hypothetical protein
VSLLSPHSCRLGTSRPFRSIRSTLNLRNKSAVQQGRCAVGALRNEQAMGSESDARLVAGHGIRVSRPLRSAPVQGSLGGR